MVGKTKDGQKKKMKSKGQALEEDGHQVNR